MWSIVQENMVNITSNQGNENQTIVRYHFIPIRMAKKQNPLK